MWHIPKLGGTHTRQNTKLDRFFDQQEKAVSLVRESIQNSLDVNTDENKPVRIVYNFSEMDTEKLRSYFKGPDGFLPSHLEACGAKIIIDSKVRVLCIEDFNTDGLTGETDNKKTGDDDTIISSNFLGFWWSEGLSEKKHGSGGSHGVGKVKLSTSSEYKCFWAFTKRSDDDQEFLLGYSQLKFHILNGSQYFGYARFGNLINDDELRPFNTNDNAELTNSFRSDFSLTRKEETGLSVVIPAVLEEINEENIIKAVLSDFNVAILKKRLEVEVKGKETDVIINSDTIADHTKTFLDANAVTQLSAFQQMLKLCKTGFFVPKDINPQKVSFEANSFSEEDLSLMQKDFDSGKMVAARFPVKITPNDDQSKSLSAWFNVFIQNAELKKNDTPFQSCVRDNLLIRKERFTLSKPYSALLLYVEDAELSEFLKYAEDPGHEKWTLNTLKDTRKYKNDTPLRIIKNSIRNFYNVLAGVEDEKIIKDVSPEIFSIREPSSGENNGTNPPPFPPPIGGRTRSPFTVTQIAGGFKIRKSKFFNDLIDANEITLPLECKISTAYKVPIGNSIRKYNRFDYELENHEQFTTSAKNSEIIGQEKNSIIFKTSHDDFFIQITGFDKNRDVEVQWQLL